MASRRGAFSAGASYWLMKSEPETFSIARLRELGCTPWDGVRNYQARNLLRDHLRVGDGVLFYHSSCEPPGVVGLARVASEAYADASALRRESPYYDPKSRPEEPRWFVVDVEFVEEFPRMVTLAELKADPSLSGMLVTRRGQRLSIQPVEAGDFARVVELGSGVGVVVPR